MTETTPTKCDDLMAWLRAMPSVQEIDAELRKAQAVREWCLQRLPVSEGDRVRITRAPNTANGWRPYRECLAVGAVATVVRVDFNRYSLDGAGAWHADIRLDREWSHSPDLGMRWWNGPADETPEGMEPPTKYDRETYPAGRRHTFSMLADSLERIRDAATASA